MFKRIHSIQLMGCFLITLLYSGILQKANAAPFLLADSSHFGCILTIEEYPFFPPPNIKEWIKRHLIYPDEAFEKNREGKVYTHFVIDTNGRVKNISISQSSDTIFNEEAISVIQRMPKWIPCKRRGKPVQISSVLPITFKLNEAILLPLVDEMPVFPNDRLVLWLKEETRKCYESLGMKSSITGKTYVNFIIEKDGRATYPEIIKSSGFPELDAEALKIINRMPGWKPGTHYGRPVRINYSVPIRFSPI